MLKQIDDRYENEDREGDYLCSAIAARMPACDANFAGFGQFLTGSSGAFLFRTIKAGLYVGRTRHFQNHRSRSGWLQLRNLRQRHTGRPGWAALPFSLTQTGAIDRNIHTAASSASLDLYVE